MFKQQLWCSNLSQTSTNVIQSKSFRSPPSCTSSSQSICKLRTASLTTSCSTCNSYTRKMLQRRVHKIKLLKVDEAKVMPIVKWQEKKMRNNRMSLILSHASLSRLRSERVLQAMFKSCSCHSSSASTNATSSSLMKTLEKSSIQ